MLIRAVEENDYDALLACWLRSPGITVNDCDTRSGISAYLRRNPGLSMLAQRDQQIIGTLLCGHDGRRGYLHHMWVDECWRRQGVARHLFEHCLSGLRRLSIHKAHLMVKSDNRSAQQFWSEVGCQERCDVKLYSSATAIGQTSVV